MSDVERKSADEAPHAHAAKHDADGQVAGQCVEIVAGMRGELFRTIF